VNGTQHYDAAIIGAGQGGKPFAIAMAAAGYGTAIIEREHVGGSCVRTKGAPRRRR
jgi:pyruvate/2-oxoglutarate dehydrogenase complex dihydrolipoamide dehydrogenase (E3) component